SVGRCVVAMLREALRRVGYQSYVYKLSYFAQVEAGGDAPSEPKVDQRAVVPSENGLSHTPVIAPKPPSTGGYQPQPTGSLKPSVKTEDIIQTVLTEMEAHSVEDLKQQKGFVREQRRQYKELKELVRRHHRRTAELIKEQAGRVAELQAQHQRRRAALVKGRKRDGKKSRSEASLSSLDQELGVLEAESSQRLADLREQQQQQLLALRQEQYYSEKYQKREHIKQPPVEGGLGAMTGVWLSPFSEGTTARWSTLVIIVVIIIVTFCLHFT
ncbi:hypothetical protein CRUP_030864, partial [Coryphaenoides rupestris]